MEYTQVYALTEFTIQHCFNYSLFIGLLQLACISNHWFSSSGICLISKACRMVYIFFVDILITVNMSSWNVLIVLCRPGDPAQPLSRVIPIPKSQLSPYRAVIIMRLIILGLFFNYRVTHPVDSAFGLWLVSVICEIWFAVSWVLDQFPKWSPINRETYIDRLSERYASKTAKHRSLQKSWVKSYKERALCTVKPFMYSCRIK